MMKRWYMYGGQVRRWFRWRKEYWVVSDYGDRIGPFRDLTKARAATKALNDGYDLTEYDLS